MVAQLSGAEPVRSTIVGHASLRRDPERSHCAEDQGYSRAPCRESIRGDGGTFRAKWVVTE